MWRLWIAIGWLAWALTIFASGSMNFLSGYGFGRNTNEAIVLALLGVAADGWKSLGPIFIVGLYRDRRVIVLLAAVLIWLACFAVAVTAAVGLIGETRSSIHAEHEALRSEYNTRLSKLAELTAERDRSSSSRSTAEIKADISAILMRSITSDKRFRGTVESVSKSCTNVTSRTASACSEIATLNRELATAKRREFMTTEIDRLKDQIDKLSARGAGVESDAQSDFIMRVSGGFISKSDVPLALIGLIVLMIEMVSALGPVVLTEFAATAKATRLGATRSDMSRDAVPVEAEREEDVRSAVYEYMAARVTPSSDAQVGAREVWVDYVRWCLDQHRDPMRRASLISAIDRIGADDLAGRLRIEGDQIVGCTLRADNDQTEHRRPRRLTNRTGSQRGAA